MSDSYGNGPLLGPSLDLYGGQSRFPPNTLSPPSDMAKALMGQSQPPAQSGMLSTPPPPNLAPIGGITGEGGSAQQGGFMDTLMHEYLNQRMQSELAAKAHNPRHQTLMDLQRQQGQQIMEGVPQPGPMPMGPR